VSSFHETGEFGGRKKGDIARSPPPGDHGFLLVHHLIENPGQILTVAGVVVSHGARHPIGIVQYSCTVRSSHQDYRGASNLLSHANLAFHIRLTAHPHLPVAHDFAQHLRGASTARTLYVKPDVEPTCRAVRLSPQKPG